MIGSIEKFLQDIVMIYQFEDYRRTTTVGLFIIISHIRVALF